VKEEVMARLMEEKIILAEDQWYAATRRSAAVRVLLDIPLPDPFASGD
jgi:hypothetical protein